MSRRCNRYKSRRLFGLAPGSDIIESWAMGLGISESNHGRKVVMLGHIMA
jgi:hypothetical protein